MYKHFFKRVLDILLSGMAILALIPFWILLFLAIKIDSKGPIFFKQKRLGIHKKTFSILKFRTMRIDTPHDTPTHLLENPEQYITKIGKWLRKTSIDELPQVFNIFAGQMSIIGPRPALWNQDDLIAEREKYGANDVKPGLTGWAQINGRDELEIEVKAKYDGEYVQRLSFGFDCKCFFGTIKSVLKHDGVVEGGTGELHKEREETQKETQKRSEETAMALKLMYITNRAEVAKIATGAGVDRIFVDMEYIGKDERQKGLDTVKSHHTIEDVKRLRGIVPEGSLLVRVNPIHEAKNGLMGSQAEIEATIAAGADIIMLPMFQTADEVRFFISCVGGRAKTLLLVETPAAVENLDEILQVHGIDEIHIGLNDLHLAWGKKFMFELLADGTVDRILEKIRPTGITYGFGGIARIGHGLLPAEYVIAEHYRLGSSMAILSRSFCNANNIDNLDVLQDLFQKGVADIRKEEARAKAFSQDEFGDNHREVEKLVKSILESQEQ